MLCGGRRARAYNTERNNFFDQKTYKHDKTACMHVRQVHVVLRRGEQRTGTVNKTPTLTARNSPKMWNNPTPSGRRHQHLPVPIPLHQHHNSHTIRKNRKVTRIHTQNLPPYRRRSIYEVIVAKARAPDIRLRDQDRGKAVNPSSKISVVICSDVAAACYSAN